MAHNLTERADGTVEMAFTGPREAIWHGLGQNLDENASIEDWIKAAGMDWTVLDSPIQFRAAGDVVTFPARRALYRSDTMDPLSIVSDDYKVVQPGEVIEFFRDLTELHGMRLSTAGTLFGGRRFWALADTGKSAEITAGDHVQGHLLLTTAVDGSMATTAKFVATRVVCHNTLTVAMSERARNQVRVTHHRVFDPTAVKIDLGILDTSWGEFIKSLRKMADTKMDAIDTRRFYQKLFYDPDRTADEQSWGAVRMVKRLLDHAMNGSGSDMSRGTAWGALCGATELFTHGPRNDRKRDPSHLFWESYCGTLENRKRDVYRELKQLVAA